MFWFAIVSLVISYSVGASIDTLCILAGLWAMFCLTYPKLQNIYDTLTNIKHINKIK